MSTKLKRTLALLAVIIAVFYIFRWDARNGGQLSSLLYSIIYQQTTPSDPDPVVTPSNPADPVTPEDPVKPDDPGPSGKEDLLDENGYYYSKNEVALYIHQYGKLPGNFITKKDAEALGWSGGSIEKYAPGKCIGGGTFGNNEKLLPVKKGRKYYECDIDTKGKSSRGAKRIVFSNDGLIYYTDDHYETFELLYGEP